MIPSPLIGPRLKVERAHRHINELERVRDAFMQSDFYSLTTELDPETGGHAFRYTPKLPIPPDFALIVGDVVHNLRASFDFIASEIVRASGGNVRPEFAADRHIWADCGRQPR